MKKEASEHRHSVQWNNGWKWCGSKVLREKCKR